VIGEGESNFYVNPFRLTLLNLFQCPQNGLKSLQHKIRHTTMSLLSSAAKTFARKAFSATSRRNDIAVRSVTTLKETLEAQVPVKQQELLALKKEHGNHV